MAVKSDEEGTCYRLCLPEIESIQTVLVFETHDYTLAIPAAKVESVGFKNNTDAKSLGQLMDLKKPSALDESSEDQVIAFRTASGMLHCCVAKVVGQRTLKFSTADRVLPDMPGYLGVAVSESELVLLIDIDYWNAQR